MTRLTGRVARLEHQLGRCPSCASRRALLEIVTPNTRTIPGTDSDTDTGPCPACGQPRQVISCVFSFDLHDDEHERGQRSGPASEQARQR